MSLFIHKPGPLSLFQDAGRHGYQAYGAPVCGVMDQVAYRLANALVGNFIPMPVLEMTLSGPQIEFTEHACIAVCGAPFVLTCDKVPLALNRPHLIRAGQVLEIGPPPPMAERPPGQARASLAIAGGVKLTTTMDSASTDLRSRMGGIAGRALAKGDRLTLQKKINVARLEELNGYLDDFRIYLPAGLGLAPRSRIRVTRGTHWTVFGTQQQQQFLSTSYTISSQSDRMGYRLDGPALRPEPGLQILSEPTAFGTVQVPPDGKPIILMADRQTTGGYPKIANVAAVDLPVLARCLPGESMHFSLISMDEAHRQFIQREQLTEEWLQSLEPLRAQIESALT